MKPEEVDWKEYEKITKTIYETLGQRTGVKVECYGNSCKIMGQSGVEHQVDVLTSHSDGLHEYKTIIECKYWNENINKDIIMKVKVIVDETDANKGIIVSKLGFTPDAVKVAKFHKIGLIELREPNDKDWKDISIPINIKKDLPVTLVNDLKTYIKPENSEYLMGLNAEITKDITEFRTSDGEVFNFHTVFENFRKEIFDKKEVGIFEKEVNYDNAYMIYNKTNEEIPFLGFKLKIEFLYQSHEFNFVGREDVYMILKAIFENKTLKVLNNGIIKEHKPKD